MRYAGILENDFVNGEGVCVSYWAQGCPFHCKGCHNPQTWDFKGGISADPAEIIEKVLTAISANGIKRNLSILGGEPLSPDNLSFTSMLVKHVTEKHPDIKIFIWTGYEYVDLCRRILNGESDIKFILDKSYMLATGQFILEQRDVSLTHVGSKNQRVLYKGKDY